MDIEGEAIDPLSELADAVRATEYEIVAESCEWTERGAAKFVDYCITVPLCVVILFLSADTPYELPFQTCAAILHLGYTSMNLSDAGTFGKRLYDIRMMHSDGSTPSLLRLSTRWLIQHGFFAASIALALGLPLIKVATDSLFVRSIYDRTLITMAVTSWVFYAAQLVTLIATNRCIHDHLTGIVVGVPGSTTRRRRQRSFQVIAP